MDTAEKKNTAGEREPILALTTLAPERPVATIDDVQHEFRLLIEFGATEHQELTRDSERYDELWKKDKLSAGEQRQMERLLDRLLKVALVDSDALREQLGERLTGAVKREIVLTFTNAPWLMAARALQKETDQEAEESSTTES